MIIARVKDTFRYNQFEILLNEVIDWGNAMEVEAMIDNEEDAKETEEKIEEFMKNELGIEKLLEKEKLLEMNEEYNNKVDFESVKIEDVIDYVQGKTDNIKLI